MQAQNANKSDRLSSAYVSEYCADMRANQLLKNNIAELLKQRGASRKDLAQWCYRSESWISKIFKETRREFPNKYLDRIADFFGLATYQLFQPGVSKWTERRSGLDRRGAKERRISHETQLARNLEARLKPMKGGRVHAETTTAVPDPLREVFRDLERRFARLLSQAESRGQAATPRRAQPATSARLRKAGA